MCTAALIFYPHQPSGGLHPGYGPSPKLLVRISKGRNILEHEHSTVVTLVHLMLIRSLNLRDASCSSFYQPTRDCPPFQSLNYCSQRIHNSVSGCMCVCLSVSLTTSFVQIGLSSLWACLMFTGDQMCAHVTYRDKGGRPFREPNLGTHSVQPPSLMMLISISQSGHSRAHHCGMTACPQEPVSSLWGAAEVKPVTRRLSTFLILHGLRLCAGTVFTYHDTILTFPPASLPSYRVRSWQPTVCKTPTSPTI